MRYRERGADRVIFGTAAVADPGVVQEAARLLAGGGGGGARRPQRQGGGGGLEGDHARGRAGAGRAREGLGRRRASSTPTCCATAPCSGPTSPASRRWPAQAGLRITAAGGVSILDDLDAPARRSSRSAWTRSSWARPSTRSASPWPRPWQAAARADAGQAPHPLPRRGPRPRGQGRAASCPCATPAIPWSARPATTRRARTSWCSWTSPPPPTRGRSCSTWCGGWRTRSSCPSRWAAACARVEDADALLRAGADKVAVNTAAVARPRAARASWPARFGSQAVVLAVDARRRDGRGGWEVFVHGGRTPTGRDAVAWAREGAERGAGEILLTSMDRDGTQDGFDVALTRAVAEAVQRARGRLRRLRHRRAHGRGARRDGQGQRRPGRLGLPLRRDPASPRPRRELRAAGRRGAAREP